MKAAPRFEIFVDGTPVEAREDLTVAAALLNSGRTVFRVSVRGEPRGPLCAMGICFECRLTINGLRHRRACLEWCEPGMKVITGD